MPARFLFPPAKFSVLCWVSNSSRSASLHTFILGAQKYNAAQTKTQILVVLNDRIWAKYTHFYAWLALFGELCFFDFCTKMGLKNTIDTSNLVVSSLLTNPWCMHVCNIKKLMTAISQKSWEAWRKQQSKVGPWQQETKRVHGRKVNKKLKFPIEAEAKLNHYHYKTNW